MPSTELMIAIGSPLTNALGIAGSVGSHRLWSQLPRGGRRRARVRDPSPLTGSPAVQRVSAVPLADADHVRASASLAWAALRSAVSWSSSPCWSRERLLCRRQRRHRGVLAGLRVDRGLVGLLLGQSRRRLLVDLFGAGPLQVGHDLLGTGGQRLPRRGGVDDVGGVGRGQIRTRWPVDIGRCREGVESLLRGRDRRGRVVDGAPTAVHIALCRCGVVARRLDVDDGFVDALLLGLHGCAEFLQLLVDIRDRGDQRTDRIGITRLGGR